MPPKSARGRKKAIAKGIVQNGSESKMKSETLLTNGSDLNHDNFNKLIEKKENKITNIDIPTEDKNSNGNECLQNLIESSETVGEMANNSSSADALVVSDKLKETKKTEEVTNSNVENDTNLNSKVAPLKRGRPKATVSAESVKVTTETVVLVSGVDEDKKESLAEQSHKVMTDDSSKSNTPEENRSDVPKDNDKTEPDTNVDISDNKNKLEGKKVPLKRGRQKKVIEEASDKQLQAEENVPSKRGHLIKSDKLSNLKKIEEDNEEPSENILDEQLQTEEKVQSKRGRKKANPLKSPMEKINEEKPSKGIPDKQIQTEENVPSKRGRKKANIPLKSDDSDVKNIKEVNEEESSSVTKEQKDYVNVPTEELNMPSTRGRKKAYQKETVKDFSDKGSDVNLNEPSQDKIKKNKNVKSTKDGKKEVSSQVSKLTSVGHKRKNETSAEEIEKNKHDFNETKVLKVTLQRNVDIDKMYEEQTKITETGGAKNTKAGGKRAKEDVDSKESGEKSPKMPKGESKSKGQSKKDKMPDVTVLDFDNSSTSPSGKPWSLKISSWNVNGVRAWLEKNGLAYITHENPDVVAFQETKCSDKMLPKEVNVAGYHSYWLAGDKDGYSGVGLLSKKEPVSVNYGIGVEEHDKEGRVITAEYEAFYLVTAYIPNAGRGLVRLNYRMQWDKDFRSYIKNLEEKKPVVLCGDLNVAHEEIDLANPKGNKKNAGFTKEEREGFSTLLSEGFIDSFRHLYPEEKGAYTFWTYMMNSRAKNVGWRLDYFVLSEKLTDHLCDSVIRKDVFGSDHCPITLFLCI